jgi:hypothetical protein
VPLHTFFLAQAGTWVRTNSLAVIQSSLTAPIKESKVSSFQTQSDKGQVISSQQSKVPAGFPTHCREGQVISSQRPQPSYQYCGPSISTVRSNYPYSIPKKRWITQLKNAFRPMAFWSRLNLKQLRTKFHTVVRFRAVRSLTRVF